MYIYYDIYMCVYVPIYISIDLFLLFLFLFLYLYMGECPPGVMFKAMDGWIIVCEFKYQSCLYVHFQANTFRKV